jgi:hypothetical protein
MADFRLFPGDNLILLRYDAQPCASSLLKDSSGCGESTFGSRVVRHFRANGRFMALPQEW